MIVSKLDSMSRAMSDKQLRELERRWKETGASLDETALLQERLRVGDLDDSRVELAAYLGHPAALLLLGREQDERPVEDWLYEIPREREFLQRFVLAGGTASLDAWQRDHPTWPDEYRAREEARTHEERLRQAIFGPLVVSPANPRQDEPVMAIQAAERLIVCPCEEHEHEVHDLVDNATAHGLLAAQPALIAATLVAVLFRRDEEPDESLRFSVQEVVGNACLALVDPGADLLLHDLNVRERHQVSRLPVGAVPNCPQVWDGVRGDVVPWLLGHSDPVRERVEARHGSGSSGPKASA